MKIKFEAVVMQKKRVVRLSNTQSYQDVICVLEGSQYYQVRFPTGLISKVKKISVGQKWVFTVNTFTKNSHNHSTGKTHYNILLIAENIQKHEPIAKNVATKQSGHKDLELAG